MELWCQKHIYAYYRGVPLVHYVMSAEASIERIFSTGHAVLWTVLAI